MSFTIALPISPSVNAMYRNVPGKGRVKSAKAKAWTTKAGWLLKTAMITPLPPGRYTVEINVPASMTGDIDNIAKPAIDLLVKHALTSDDRMMQSITVRRNEAVASGMMIVSAYSTVRSAA